MKRLFALLAFLAFSSLPSFATWSQVGSPQAFYCGDGGSGAPISACTQTITAPVAGHLLVVNALYNDSTSAMTISSVCSGASCTGTAGGWVHPSSCHGYATGFQAMDWAYTLSATTSTSLTVSFSGSGGQYIGLVVFEYAGTGPFVFDACVTKIDPAQTTTPAAGSITTTGANDLAIAGVYADITFPGTPAVSPSPWVTPAIFASDSAYSHALNISPRALQAVFTHSNAVYAPGGTIAFKDSTALSTARRKHVLAFWRGVTDGLAAAVSNTIDYMKILAADTFSSVNLSNSGQNYNGSFDQPHEAWPHGWPSAWGETSAFGDMNSTIDATYGQEKALEPWGVVYVTQSVANGVSPASNTRVAVKDCTVSTKSIPTPVSYYVSSTGNDSWSGTLAAANSTSTDGPFRTLTKAQTALQASSSIKTVRVRAGIYTLGADLSFASTADNAEVWYAYPGEAPIIDGSSSAYHVVVNNVATFTMAGFTFQNTAPNAIQVQWGSNITLRWNTFTNANQAAILGWGTSNPIIDSNTVNGQSPGNPNGSVASGYAAINFSGNTTNGQFTHNLIRNAQGGGIYLADGPTDPPNNNNLIDRNLLINVCTNVTDFGALYIYDPSQAGTGNKITNNVVLGYGSGSLTDQTKGVYLDDGASNTLVSGNIISGHGEWALQIHGGKKNTVTNNIFDISGGTLVGLYQSTNSSPDNGMPSNVFTKNIVYSSGAFPSTLWNAFMNQGDALPSDSNNLYYSATGATIPNTDVVDTSRVLQNPLFTNASANNYSMPNNSPAFATVGMTAFVTDQGLLTASFGTGSPWLTRVLINTEFDDSWYAEDFQVADIPGDKRLESDGSFSVTAGNVENTSTGKGRVAHWNAPFPRICMTQQTNSDGTCTTPPAQYGGLVFSCKARLILSNSAGTDDRYLAKYVMQVGADPYPDNTTAGIANNPAIGGGKEKIITPDWRVVSFTTLTEAQLKLDPPPIDMTGVATDATVTPHTPDFGDGQAIALGMRFKSDTAGFIKAIRFYKSAANTGTHIGSLWSDSGTLLSQVTFTGEAASGWQEMALATPVAVAANTSYRVSYWAPNGHYSSDANYFTSADQEKWPLHAMRSIGTGGQYNGWFALTNVFPATFVNNGANFYVDVVFVKTTSDTVTYSLFK